MSEEESVKEKVRDKMRASRAVVNVGIYEVPHVDQQTREELEAETPPYLRDARLRGIPSLGAGAIYPIPESDIKCDPFPLPDYWPRAYALDVGWNWTAALWAAWDRETATMYLYSEYKAGEEKPPIHASAVKARGAWIPGLIDPAANGRQQGDGERLMAMYENEGLDLSKADNSVESGLYNCWMDLSIGRIKVFSTLQAFFWEYRQYHRDEKGKIVKKNDHLMDDLKYLRNSGLSVAKAKPFDNSGVNVRAQRPHGKSGY